MPPGFWLLSLCSLCELCSYSFALKCRAMASEIGTMYFREAVAARSSHFTSVAWASDGKSIAAAGIDGCVWLFELAGRAEPRVLEGHAGPVKSAAWSPDGKWSASGSIDNTVGMWDSKRAAAAALESFDDNLVTVAPKCSNRGQKCHQYPAKVSCQLYLKTEEWVSG